MSPYVAYFLGMITLLLIFIPFYVLSFRFSTVSEAYRALFCNQTIT